MKNVRTSRLLRRTLTGVLLAAGLGLATAGPAIASVDTNLTDPPLMSGPQRDFGNNLILNVPTGGGVVNWDVTNGVVTPWVSGQLYLNNNQTFTTVDSVVEYHWT